MGLFDTLFSTNKKKWDAILINGDTPLEIKRIINSFFNKDNISVERYIENNKANSVVDTGLDFWELANSASLYEETRNQRINCTPTFRKYFANSRLNRGLGVPDWFYTGYPDVANWMHKNSDLIENETTGKEEKYFKGGKLNDDFFRYLIDRYKQQTGNVLECSTQNK